MKKEMVTKKYKQILVTVVRNHNIKKTELNDIQKRLNKKRMEMKWRVDICWSLMT